MKHEPPALAFLAEELEKLAARDLLRRRPPPLPADAVSFCSNDYLGFAADAAEPAPGGAGASRLVAGERDEHVALERAVARWLELPAALAFSSGFAANLGALTSLVADGDLLVSDALNHASIIDGARLTRAEIRVVPHLDLGATERALAAKPTNRRAWVVTESYFSMDADSPDLARLRQLCDAKGAALVVDEAHALGVLGPSGRGMCAAAGVVPDVLVGTFGKSFGASGAFIAGCDALVDWLWNRARPFVFSTGMSPVVAATARRNLAAASVSPDRRNRCVALADRFRAGLVRLGITPLGHGPIVPWVVGGPARALALGGALRARGVHVAPIRPPSVPEGTARLRFAVTARHSERDVDQALGTIAEVLRCERTSSS